MPSGRQNSPTTQSQNRREILQERENIRGKFNPQILMLGTLPKAVSQGVLLATPWATVSLVSPLGLIALSVEPTGKSKPIQSLIIRA